jgi:anaerobic ribonucleoside-triphosphate reductase activating protein
VAGWLPRLNPDHVQPSVYFSHAHFPVRALGHGRRVGVWLQGCSIRCAGCIVPQTWTAGPQHLVPVRDLVARLMPWLERCDGVTISGGEPFDQPEALQHLLPALREVVRGDIWAYSGHPWSQVSRFPELLAWLDGVITEPFRADLPSVHPYIGSSNQEWHGLTPLGETRFAAGSTESRARDTAIAPDAIRMAGVPVRGEMAALVNDLTRRGISARSAARLQS